MKRELLNYDLIKKDFRLTFSNLLNSDISLKSLLFEIFASRGSAYIIGGFLRDIIQKKESRDIDIIVDLSHDKLIECINEVNLKYCINRHNGIKINFKNIQLDIWSIENNWAFKNNLVKLNDENKLESIAKGCFFNYDSLVINLHTLNMNIRNYINFLETNELDILQKKPLYKILNPTKEANILRSFYLRKLFNKKFSLNTRLYLLSKIAELRDKNLNPLEVLENKKKEYSKYEEILSKNDLNFYLLELENNNQINNQLILNI